MSEDFTTEAKGVEVGTVGVGNVIKDSEGHVWSLPDLTEDFSDLNEPDLLFIPNKDPRFWYQGIRPDQLQEYLYRQYVAVTLKEVGLKELPPGLARDMGQTLDTYYRIGDLIIVKIPMAFRERDERAHNRAADEAIDAAGPTEKQIALAKAQGKAILKPSQARTEGNVTTTRNTTRRRIDEPVTVDGSGE